MRSTGQDDMNAVEQRSPYGVSILALCFAAIFRTVERCSELADGNPQQVTVAGNDVLLYWAQGRVYALANRCSHRGGPLHEGKIEDQEIVCPWHSSRFCMQDGSVVQGSAVAPQPCYETRVRQGRIEVRSRT
jgi:nitrite reductase/ring-hydroxylating ferredoxin subunit